MPAPPVSLWVEIGPVELGVVFPCPTISPSIALDILMEPDFEGLESKQPPKVGEWTRIEISQEEENGRCILSFSVGGKEIGREDMGDCKETMYDVKVFAGSKWSDSPNWPAQPGFIRGLVILDKQ